MSALPEAEPPLLATPEDSRPTPPDTRPGWGLDYEPLIVSDSLDDLELSVAALRRIERFNLPVIRELLSKDVASIDEWREKHSPPRSTEVIEDEAAAEANETQSTNLVADTQKK